MKFSLLVILLSLSKITISQTIFDPKIYSKYVYKIDNINPSDTDYSDLEFLKRKLHDKQIVILGENGHGDGSTFEAKTRLIKYLSTQLDFKTIAFEGGGFFEMYYSSLNKDVQNSFFTEIQNSWFEIWSNSSQTKALIDFLEQNKEFIKYYGIENQAGNKYWTDLPLILENLIGNEVFNAVDYEGFKSNYLNFYNSIYIDTSFTSRVDISKLQMDLERIKLNLSNIQNDHCKTMIQAIFNIEGFIQQIKLNFGTYSEQNQSISLRDSLMTENVKWWLENNPNQKLIIWTANLHAADNLNQTIYAEGDDFYQVMQPLGQRLKDEYGEKVFSMAFTSSEGNQANIYEIEPTSIISDTNSWEFELSQGIKYDYAYVDFEKIKRKRKYRKYNFNSNLLGYKNRPGNWLNIFDSVFYIRTMTRSEMNK